MKSKENNKPKEGEGEDDEEDSDEMDFTDIGSLSILDQYRNKNERLTKEIQEKEWKIKLLQNECETFLKISKQKLEYLISFR